MLPVGRVDPAFGISRPRLGIRPAAAAGARQLKLLLFAAARILLRGHNEPGGGFIGGPLAVAASALAATVLGTQAACRRMPMAPLPLLLGGVLLSLAAGLPALLHDRRYLAHL